MRLVGIDQISGDETLGKAIFDIDGKLLNAGVSKTCNCTEAL